MIHDFDPAGIDHPLECLCPCCTEDYEDMELGIGQAEIMMYNMQTYGTIDAPRRDYD